MFSEEAAARVVAFIHNLTHTKGRWAGTPFDLLPWQDKLIRELFGTLNEDGHRQYRTAYVEVGRKNGKSELAAAVALYLLFGDGEAGGEVYGAAKDADQASIVFNVAAQMVRNSKVLSARAKVIDSSKRIIVTKGVSSGSVYRAIPADAAGSHGFNASGIVFDEVHVQPNRELWDVLHTSTGAREQPLMFGATTAGFDRNSICWELHEHARQVSAGLLDDPGFYGLIYAADEEDDWKLPATWAKANPSLGQTISHEYLEAEARKAEQIPAYQNTFRRLHLSQWTSQDSRWLDMSAWDACAGPVNPAPGRPCYGGLDLATTTDLAAFVLVFPPEIEGGEYEILPHFWIPEDNLHERVRRDRVPYDLWAAQQFIRPTPGNVIDYGIIRRDIEGLALKFNLRETAFDRWGAAQMTQELDGAGLVLFPFGQGFASMSSPTVELGRLVMERRIRHGGNPVLRWMADNVAVDSDPAGNLKPSKKKSTQRIDGIVAAIMALDRAVRNGDGRSVYDTQGIFTIG